MKYKFNNNPGFTLIEALVAIAIFAFAITGLISITANGVFNTTFVKNKFTASYLALEGAELVRNIRDTASIQGNNWGDITGTLLSDCMNGQTCYIDADVGDDAIIVEESCNGDCPYLSFQRNTARFNYRIPDSTDNIVSIFKRTISIVNVPSGTGVEEIRVVSRVDWQQGSKSHNATYVFDLMNWTEL